MCKQSHRHRTIGESYHPAIRIQRKIAIHHGLDEARTLRRFVWLPSVIPLPFGKLLLAIVVLARTGSCQYSIVSVHPFRFHYDPQDRWRTEEPVQKKILGFRASSLKRLEESSCLSTTPFKQQSRQQKQHGDTHPSHKSMQSCDFFYTQHLLASVRDALDSAQSLKPHKDKKHPAAQYLKQISLRTLANRSCFPSGRCIFRCSQDVIKGDFVRSE